MSNANDFIIENGVLIKYKGPGGDVIIPEEVTSIGAKAFYKCENLKSINMYNNVTSIGGKAFGKCSELINIVISQSVTSIDYEAFEECRSLTHIDIPQGVTSIESSTFSFCTKLENISIPDSVTSIGFGAFFDCKSLTDVTIPASVTHINQMAFRNSGLKSICIPESILSVGHDAFSGCGNLCAISILNRNLTIDEYFFGDFFPEKLVCCAKDLHWLMSDSALKKYLLNKEIWGHIDSLVQFEIFCSHQSKSLMPVYWECTIDSNVFCEAFLSLISGKPSAKDCNAAANYMILFSAQSDAVQLRKLYEQMTKLKAASKTMGAINNDALLMTKLNMCEGVNRGAAATEKNSSEGAGTWSFINEAGRNLPGILWNRRILSSGTQI